MADDAIPFTYEAQLVAINEELSKARTCLSQAEKLAGSSNTSQSYSAMAVGWATLAGARTAVLNKRPYEDTAATKWPDVPGDPDALSPDALRELPADELVAKIEHRCSATGGFGLLSDAHLASEAAHRIKEAVLVTRELAVKNEQPNTLHVGPPDLPKPYDLPGLPGGMGVQVTWYGDLEWIAHWVRDRGGYMTYGQVDAIRGVPRAENPTAAVYNDDVDPAAAHGLLLTERGIVFVAIHDRVEHHLDGLDGWWECLHDGEPAPLAYKPDAR